MVSDEDTNPAPPPPLESPTSRFTAVNGKEQAPTNGNGSGSGSGSGGGNGNGNGNGNENGNENGNGNGNGNGSGSGSAKAYEPSRRNSDDRPNGQPRITPPGQEKLTISTSTPNQEWGAPVNGDRNTYQSSAPYHDADGSHKRKRSDSLDQNSSTSYRHSLATPSTKQTPTTATTATTEQDPETPRDVALPPSHGHRYPYSATNQYNKYHPHDNTPLEDRGESAWRGHYEHGSLISEDHLSELQRETQNMDAQDRDYDHGSPGDGDRSGGGYGYGNDRREMSAQSDPKKRKRNFSNRTKTGCMTCRRRKKKCDETKPECNNCVRGGFVCSGYQQRGQWPKTEQKQAPIPLQSKNDYESGYQSSPYGSQHLGRREPLPGFRGQGGLRVDPQHGRSLDIDDDAPTISYSGQTPTPITASSASYPERQLKGVYDRVGPLHDLSRQDSETATPQSASANLPQILHPQMHSESPHSNPQMAAQLALSNLASSDRPRTQKEEMLAGRHYFPFDKELVLERERCNGACWRFNSSTNPNNGVSPEERARQFRDILQPKESAISPTHASPVNPSGRVGENVVVEAPFNCDYGYNITIGQDVAIGKNCTILDTCEVKIGDRCNIGPNVNIYTATLPIDPKRRLGSRGPSLGRRMMAILVSASNAFMLSTETRLLFIPLFASIQVRCR
ncbi:hypothetical protein BJ875DRAFT_16005 [Amylocarpus encephaloides]|uniref:Zn(2)-C6 fungal-type domain-containing protein n=1 Tax=Amylocarpus encephaloides TaxID=45428 RepID=A0A9P8C5A5_9HELO|nr:hypothetical protein BJ875DRAFT_16005 [Amylocarpus encephaloides]